VDARRRLEESGCLGSQPQTGGKSHPRLNTGERPIANKYREGKMQRTLKRESKVLEIVKREAIEASHREKGEDEESHGAGSEPPRVGAPRRRPAHLPRRRGGRPKRFPSGDRRSGPSLGSVSRGWAHPSPGRVSVGRRGERRPRGGWRGRGESLSSSVQPREASRPLLSTEEEP